MFGLLKKKVAPEATASQIVPRIKHQNFLAAVAGAGVPEGDKPYTEPLAGDLLVTYAFDLPEAVRWFGRATWPSSDLRRSSCARRRSPT